VLIAAGAAGCAHGQATEVAPPESELDHMRQDNASMRHRVRQLEERVKMLERGATRHEVALGAPSERPLPVVKLEAPAAKTPEAPPPADGRRLRKAVTLQRADGLSDAADDPYAGYETGYGSGPVAPGSYAPEASVPDEWQAEPEAPAPELSVQTTQSDDGPIKSYRLVGSDLVNATKRHKPKADRPPRGKRGSAIVAEYERARALYKGGDFVRAEQAFARFVERHAKHDYADNALYWQGEAAYDQAHYSDALASFTAVVERYGGGNKAADALLKIGLCYGKVGDTANAKDVLEQLIAAYPKANASRIARSKLPQYGGTP